MQEFRRSYLYFPWIRELRSSGSREKEGIFSGGGTTFASPWATTTYVRDAVKGRTIDGRKSCLM